MAAAALGAVAGDEAAYNAVLDGYLGAKDGSAYVLPMCPGHQALLDGEVSKQNLTAVACAD